MKKITIAVFIFLFGLSIFAQDTNNTPETIKTAEIKLFQGEDYMPYIFEPYQADYVCNAKGLGMSFNLVDYSTKIVELKDRWSEEVRVGLSDDLRKRLTATTADEEIALSEKPMSMVTEIDLKTGLLLNATASFGQQTGLQVMSLNVNKDNVMVNFLDEKKQSHSQTFLTAEKLYPCDSSVFLSYLPLDENFVGSFKCINFDFEKMQLNRFTRTMKVVGSETIITKAGRFETFKIMEMPQVKVEKLSGDWDKMPKTKATEKLRKDVGKFGKGVEGYFMSLRGYSWIDKKSRKLIKSELDFKKFGAKVTVELQSSKDFSL
jgi:hypothetical protein